MRALVCLALCTAVWGCRSVDRDKVARDDECRGVLQRWQLFVEELDQAAGGGYEFSSTRSPGELSLQQWMVAELELANVCWPGARRKAGEQHGSAEHGRLLGSLELAIVRGDLAAARQRARAVVQLLEALAASR